MVNTPQDSELEALRQKKIQEMTKKDSNVTKGSPNPVTLTVSDFDQFIDNTPMVLVDFWAAWCGPCKMVAPILDDLAKEYQGKVWIGKVNVDEERQLAMKYGATSIPTFWVFKDGEPVGRFVGALPRPAFENIIQQLIDLDMEKVRAEKN